MGRWFLMPEADSNMSFKQAIAGTAAPRHVIEALSLIDVCYWSFDNCLHRGQLVVHKALVEEIQAIFYLIEKLRFPIGKVVPIVRYHWSDEASMEDNNTSAFNYRLIEGTQKLSHHGAGKAVDINPFQNPVIYSDGRTLPMGATYDALREGTLCAASPVVREFLARGWRWGGHFESPKDYHHFDRPEIQIFGEA